MAKILVVDDEAIVRDLVQETLRVDAHQISFAADGPGALARVAEQAPDVILLDVNLQGSPDGFEVCRRVAEEHGEACKVILLTGMSDEALRLAGPEAGATAYLLKPFSPLELIQRVESVLGEAA